MCHYFVLSERDFMNEKLQQRLKELKIEYESGQKMLSNLETREASLRETLLRISGAIQVLEELMDQNGHAPQSDDAPQDET
jgi:predicted nuclease with TOPRIM domain